MKKIAILGLHLNYGGVEQSIINQANALSDNYEVELIITYKLNEEPAFKVNKKVSIKYLTDVVPNREDFKDAIKSKKYFKAFKEGVKALKILKLKKNTMKNYIAESDADIIISSRVEFAEILGKYKNKNVITITEEHAHHNNDKKYIRRLKKACKKIDYLIPVSKELTEFYKEKIPNVKCVYIPNCLDNLSEGKSKLNNKNLISIGRLSPEKGFLDLVDIFKIIHNKDKEYHLDIIGDGVEYTKIKEKIKNLKLEDSITLWGFKDKKFINEKLKESSLYLMCSYEESFGLVLIEAGSFNVPGIAFDTARGTHEIIEDGKNGYLIANRDKNEMARKAMELINDSKKLSEFGKNAYLKSQEFSFDRVKELWINFIDSTENKITKYFEKLYKNDKESFYNVVEENLKKQKKSFIVTSNPETFSYGENEDTFNNLLLDENTVLVPDGIGIVKAGRMLGYKITERITGVDLAAKLLEIANENNYKVALLGAAPEVLEQLNTKIKNDYPNIKLVKTQHGYSDDKDIFFDELVKLKPDICLVALGIPNQELLIYKHLDKFEHGVFVGVGGSFDVLSGTKKRAPKIFQKLNLEWLYRIVKEPKRLKRFWNNNVKFLFKIQKLKNKPQKDYCLIYFTLLFCFFFLVAVLNQYFVFRTDIESYLDFNMLYFCFFWTFVFLIIRYILPNKIGKYTTLIFQILLLVITIANYFYIGYFDSIVSWKDLVLSGEGMAFISSIFPMIRPKIVLTTIILIGIIIATTILSPKKYIRKNWKCYVLILCLLIPISLEYYFVNKSLTIKENEEVFNDNSAARALNDKKVIYTEWNNSRRALEITGIYEYIFRDLYFTFFNKDNPVEAKKYLDEYLKDFENDYSKDGEYYGIFENKNLILVMMESADDWQINEKSTPTIWKMKKEGIDFVNHYSPHYVTGKTAQSEFMANTGIYPKFNSLLPHYGFDKNNYEFSLANLFKNKGYSANAFHRTVGGVYNRENMMLALGYSVYYDVFKTGLTEDEYDLDRYYALKGYNIMTKSVKEKPFMNFYITFSNHSPYTLEKKECQLHYDEMKKLFPNETDDEKLCGYAQMRETDDFFKELLTRLEKDNLLKDTVIIAFSDHPNSMFMSESETNKLNKTEMFIYNPQIKHKEVTKLSSTINILPMINNLFNLQTSYFYASYDPLNDDESYILFSDYTYYNGSEILPITKEQRNRINVSKNILVSDYYNK